jgi:hypothetical protein
MFVASLVLVTSTALFFFYFQVACQKILRRKFDREYFQAIANANRLEFAVLRKTLEEYEAPVDYPRVRMMLKCDYLALTYLLRNAANVNQRYSREELLLILYFKAVFFSLMARHWLRLREKPPILKLTAILQFFANVVGQRVSMVRFGNLTASDYLLNL